MIGGEDILIDTRDLPPSVPLDNVVRCVLRRWPRAIIIDGKTGTQFESYRLVPFGHVSELLIYRDGPSFRAWERVGAAPGHVNTMVHLLADSLLLTIVVDDRRDATMRAIVDEAQALLNPAGYWAIAA